MISHSCEGLTNRSVHPCLRLEGKFFSRISKQLHTVVCFSRQTSPVSFGWAWRKHWLTVVPKGEWFYFPGSWGDGTVPCRIPTPNETDPPHTPPVLLQTPTERHSHHPCATFFGGQWRGTWVRSRTWRGRSNHGRII